MATQFSLYKINEEIKDLIESYIDPETGEMSDIVAAHFNTLQMKREDAIHQIGLFSLESAAKSDAVANEIKRLQVLKKSLDNRETAAKKIIANELAEGETYEFENMKISWRKSESVEVDDFAQVNMKEFLSELAFENPDLVDTDYSLKKAEIKKLAKANKPLPKGVVIVTKQNLQIK